MTLLLPSDAVLICSSQCLGINTCPAASSAATLSSSVDDKLTVAAPLNRPPWNRFCKLGVLLVPLLWGVLSSTRPVLLLLVLPLLPEPPKAWTCIGVSCEARQQRGGVQLCTCALLTIHVKQLVVRGIRLNREALAAGHTAQFKCRRLSRQLWSWADCCEC